MLIKELLKKRDTRAIEKRRLRRNGNKIRNKIKSRVKLQKSIPDKIASYVMPLLATKIITKTRETRNTKASTFGAKIDNVEAATEKRRATTLPTDIFHFSFPNEPPNDFIITVNHPTRGDKNFGSMPKAAGA